LLKETKFYNVPEENLRRDHDLVTEHIGYYITHLSPSRSSQAANRISVQGLYSCHSLMHAQRHVWNVVILHMPCR